MERVVIALGGNALQQKGDEATGENQYRRVTQAVDAMMPIIQQCGQVVITHGNGPQVGRVMLQNEAAKEITPPLGMDLCGAAVQGMIGYHLQNAIEAGLLRGGKPRPVCTVVSQVEVSPEDPAFLAPDKPIGPFYTRQEAERLAEEKGWSVKEDSGRGWRRMVASPQPKAALEADCIKMLLKAGAIVIALGGGGIPVLKKDGRYIGADAVIDKDRASSMLASEIEADTLIILTAVESAFVGYGTPRARAIGRTNAAELREYMSRGEFAAGSMLPKIEAAVRFAESKSGRRAIITNDANIGRAVRGEAGTVIEG